MPLLLVVFAPAVAALLISVLPKNRLFRWVIAVPAALFVYLITRVNAADTLAISLPWVPSLGVSLSFALDGLALLFALIITGIGALVLLYASGYFAETNDYVRFSAYTLLFMGAMLGIVLASNLLLLFVFWELTSFTSYLLIGFYHESEAARDGALRALIVTGSGGLALLAGIVLVGSAGGTFDIPVLLSKGDVLRGSPLYAPALILILVGAFTKSAQWPFHFWLPGAMAAPTPASAYLHSATMVKAGIFLLARLGLALNGTDLWLYSVTGFGLITFLYGGVIALRQTDLKAILAYSTISWLGVLVALQGAGTPDGAKALVIGILAHALYKGALFLMVGSVDHAVETRDITQLGRLARKMPYTAFGAGIAALSMAGIPPLLGFLGKEMLKVAALAPSPLAAWAWIFPAAAVIGSALTVAVALRILWDTFFGAKESQTVHVAHEVGSTMWICPAALGVLSTGLPLFLPQLVEPLVNPVLAAITGTTHVVHLHLFEGITAPFVLSMIAIAGGFALFWYRLPLIARLQANPEFNPIAAYEWLMNRALPDFAAWITSRLQDGRLRKYIGITSAVFVLFAFGSIIVGRLNLVDARSLAGFDWIEAIICVLLIVSAIVGVIAPTRLSAITVLGIEGALVALTFALFGAPDLAFTQLMVEVVSLVLFILAFHFLPDPFTIRASGIHQFRDIATAVSVGAAMTLLVLVAGAQPVGESISPWYIQNALPVGQGQNIVNVILVDFRGLDTQGEIVVLVIAAMGVTALLRLRPSDQPRGQHLLTDMKVIDNPTEPQDMNMGVGETQ
jgi:multicomponent Na+:H+ antiporter subunit A